VGAEATEDVLSETFLVAFRRRADFDTSWDSARPWLLLFEYDKNANETKRIYPGGAVVETPRDNSGRPTRITAKDSAGATQVDIGYNYKFPGTNLDQINLQSRTAHKEQGITAGAVTSYSYDSRNRLTKAEEKPGATVSASWTYGYDAVGKRTSQVRSGSTGAAAGTITWAYNDANQITSATGQTTTWTYDGAGNQTRNGSTGHITAYNDRLQAVTIAGTNQSYIGDGNTDRRTSGSVAFQNGALGTVQRTGQSNTRGPDGSAIGYKASAPHYFVTDHLGSVVGMFSSSGAYEGGYSYSPYGETRAAGTNAAITANNLRYIGQYLDANGIYKLGARYFDTTQGRFSQWDPTGQDPHYTYAGNNPINSADPSGTAAFIIPVIATAARFILPRLGAKALTMRGIGTSSRLFGNSSMGARAPGLFNQKGTAYAAGWSINRSTGQTMATFRYRSPANPHDDIVQYPW
jgi:RHS repeat-associated protein